MVSRAKGEEIVEVLGAAFGTELQMMDVDEGRMPTTRHSATPAVAMLHGSPSRRGMLWTARCAFAPT
jgi:hypothetical protein